jgi:hypothetical protein
MRQDITSLATADDRDRLLGDRHVSEEGKAISRMSPKGEINWCRISKVVGKVGESVLSPGEWAFLKLLALGGSDTSDRRLKESTIELP